MSNPFDDYKSSHQLIGVWDHGSDIDVTFGDGDRFRLSGCSPIDPSIYHQNGGWCCTVEKYFGTDEKKMKLFRSTSGVDIYEEDIQKVTDSKQILCCMQDKEVLTYLLNFGDD